MKVAWAAATVAALGGGVLVSGVAQAQTPEADPHGRTGIEEIVITASPFGQRRFDVLQGTSVLAGEALERALSASIGETLDRLPGVSQTAFGQGASRPVIRGLGGDRVRVLVGGIGTIDASTTSPDHAPAVDLATAQRVEVVRGPAALLYGSNAIGGVVNVLDGRVPMARPEGGTAALARLGYGSNANERLAAAGVDQALGDTLVLHADGYYRKADDFEVDGHAWSAARRAEEAAEHAGHAHEIDQGPVGTVDNSDLEQKGGTLGLSAVGDWGFLGASVGRTDSRYGIPGGHSHGHAEEEDHDHDHDHDHGHGEEENVHIDLEQTRLDVIGEIDRDFLIFDTTRLRFGWADYKHTELEGDEVGTVFKNKGWEGRVELVQRPVQGLLGGSLDGASGVQAQRRDFRADGEEAFVPPSVTEQYGLFTAQRLDLGPWALEAGARVERQSVEASDIRFDRDFTGLSLSGGAAYRFADGWLLGASLSRTERAPNAEELLSDGSHLATGIYEVGDRTLDEETAVGVEATLKKTGGPVTGALNIYRTDFDGFIYEAFTGAEEDGLPVARYSAADARFWGFEVELGAAVWRSGDQAVLLDASAEYVRTRNKDLDEPLPRIPPLQLRGGVSYETPLFAARAEVVWADDQDRTASFELPTDGYTVLNASLDWHPFAGRDISLLLEARNITDEEVRLSTSFLKDRVPQPGRDFRVLLRGAF